jgi:hypothetical protein
MEKEVSSPSQEEGLAFANALLDNIAAWETTPWAKPTVAWFLTKEQWNNSKNTLVALHALEDVYQDKIQARYVQSSQGRYDLMVYELCLSNMYRFRLSIESDKVLNIYPIRPNPPHMRKYAFRETNFIYNDHDEKTARLSLLTDVPRLSQVLDTMMSEGTVAISDPMASVVVVPRKHRKITFPDDDEDI